MAIIVLSLKVSSPERSQGSRINDLIEGVGFIVKNNIFLFLISMTFFISFFGMSYIPMMPVFAVEILKVGADGQGVLLGFGGIGALLTTMILARVGNFRQRGVLIIVGAFLFGSILATFALTSRAFENYRLALTIMFLMGASSATFMIPIMSSLQLMVPNHMRGRVMGFYGMTWSIMPLGGMYAGSLAGFIGRGSDGVAISVAIGGILVALFAIGPALINRNVREVGLMVSQQQINVESREGKAPVQKTIQS